MQRVVCVVPSPADSGLDSNAVFDQRVVQPLGVEHGGLGEIISPDLGVVGADGPRPVVFPLR